MKRGTEISVPKRPLFDWAKDEKLLADIKRAQRDRNIAQRAYERASKGQRAKRGAELRRTVNHCLILENELARRSGK